ncbi:MAG: hypothetical protein Tsb0014_03050 [Pleurocapsa sp.]
MNHTSSDKILLTSKTKRPLGEILIEAGLISAAQLEIALQQQREDEDNLKIGEILATNNWLKQETADFFVEQWPRLLKQKQKKPLVYYFRKAGLLDEVQINEILEEQKQRDRKIRFHRLAIEKGYLKQITVDFFVANIFDIYNSNVFSFAKPYEVLRNYSKGKTNFRRIELSKAPLMGVSLKSIQLDGSNIREANLNSCNLSGSSLIQVNLTLTNLVKAVLTEVNFERACLHKADLREAHLKEANFQQASLQGADLTDAYLFHTSFANADLRGAKLSPEYAYDVYYDSQTLFDDNFDPQTAGWKLIN